MYNNKLTEKQERVLEFMKDYLDENEMMPSIREIGAGVGLKSTSSVHSHVVSLINKGYLKRLITDTGKRRGYVLVNKDLIN